MFYSNLTKCFTLQLKSQRVKLSTLVEYPVYGLDMSKHIASRSKPANNLHDHWSPWKRRSHSTNNPDNTTYDLYAVVNHIGSLSSGHYTGNISFFNHFIIHETFVTVFITTSVATYTFFVYWHWKILQPCVRMQQITCGTSTMINEWKWLMKKTLPVKILTFFFIR